MYTDNFSLLNTLDADCVLQPKKVGAAVQELREMYTDGAMRAITWLRARAQVGGALTKDGRNTPLQQTVGSGFYGVRLDEGDYLTKRSSSAPTLTAVVNDDEAEDYEGPGQDGDIDNGGHDLDDEDDPMSGECQ